MTRAARPHAREPGCNVDVRQLRLPAGNSRSTLPNRKPPGWPCEQQSETLLSSSAELTVRYDLYVFKTGIGSLDMYSNRTRIAMTKSNADSLACCCSLSRFRHLAWPYPPSATR